MQPDLTLPEHENVFVIGDTASVFSHGQPVPGIAPAAIQEGAFAAATIRARLSGVKTPKSFGYFDKGTLATVGRAFAVAQIRRLKVAGFAAWMLWLLVHIYFLIGFRNRAIVMFQWAWSTLPSSGERVSSPTMIGRAGVPARLRTS